MTAAAYFPPQEVPVQVAIESRQAPAGQGGAAVPSLAKVSGSEPPLDTFFTPEEQATIDARLHALAIATAASSGATPDGQTAATATPEPADPNCTKDPSHPLYCIYTVQSGDTLSGIAKEYGLSGSGSITPADMLAQSNKPDVVDSDDIKPGQKLRVPLSNGIIHTAFVSESLADVAESYGVTVEKIRALSANKVGNSLAIGQEVLIPAPSELPSQAAAATPTPSPTPEATKTPTATPTPELAQAAVVEEAVEVIEAAPATQQNTLVPPPIATSTPTRVPATATATPRPAATATPTQSAAARTTQAAAPASKGVFIWPVAGPVSSYMGPAHPLGIDIDLFDNEGVPVGAVAAGTVTFAGGNPCCSYGYYVIVDHGNGITTLYAHFSKIAVKEGQKVTQGQTIGYGGSTGYATGTHLHFEMRLNGNVIDPLIYLPR